MDTDAVWNRAAMSNGGPTPAVGDQALASVLGLHSLAMSGGLGSALEMRAPQEILAAIAGYRHFGLDGAGDVWQWLSDETGAHDPDQEPEFFYVLESEADNRYAAVVPTDDTILQAFQRHIEANPDQYAPMV